MTFSIQLNGIKELQNIYAAAAEQLGEEVKAAVTDTANKIAEAAKKNCTGKLAGSITTNVADDGMSATISTDSPYAAFVEYGASVPEIHADKARVLHWKEDGKDVFAKYARAHENAPKPFLNPAFEEQADQLKDKMSEITGN